MKALAVSHNGQTVAVIGASNGGVSAHVSCVDMAVAGHRRREVLHLLLTRSSLAEDSESWSMPPLSVGDEITIRIVDVESDDPPSKRVPQTPKQPPRGENGGEDFDFNSRFDRFK